MVLSYLFKSYVSGTPKLLRDNAFYLFFGPFESFYWLRDLNFHVEIFCEWHLNSLKPWNMTIVEVFPMCCNQGWGNLLRGLGACLPGPSVHCCVIPASFLSLPCRISQLSELCHSLIMVADLAIESVNSGKNT
jgi:hypothetical protein